MKTNIIIPRDYGLFVKGDYGRRFFVSPTRHAIGKLMLESSAQIRERVSRKARRETTSPVRLRKLLYDGIKKREGTDNLVKVHTRNRINGVELYDRVYHAKLRAKSDEEIYYETQLSNPRINDNGGFGYRHSRCDCKDSYWGEVKSTEVFCSHLAAFEIALFEDERGNKSSNENLTGLTKSRLQRYPSMPFDLRKNYDLVTDMLFDFYVEGFTMAQINKKYLDDIELLSDALCNGLKDRKDTVQFGVLRQKEREIKPILAQDTQEYYGAIRQLENRLRGMLLEREFKFDGYGYEFKGHGSELVAKRYRNGFEVISIGVNPYTPPLIIRKHLGEKVSLGNSDEPFQGINIPYLSVDDNTRRKALTKVIIPGESDESQVFVPRVLKRRYAQWKVSVGV